MMKKLLCFLLINGVLWSEITVQVARDTVKLNESIQVVFKSTDKVKGNPDFKPLERDFDILSQNQSSSTRIINGQVDHEYSWTLSLMSKREGRVTIPSIRFGSQVSEPIAVQVNEAQAAAKGDPIFFEVEISPNNQVYEQSQIVYKVRFFRSVNLYNGHIGDISVSDPDAIIEPLGEDKEYDQMAGGIRYLVVERKYAVFPQHAGELIFHPIVFQGQIVTGGRSVFNMQTQHTQMSSEALKVEVKPIPPPFTRQNWLAADQVRLVDEWSGDITKVKAGEPITRTITILADGCLGSQIPNIHIPVPEGLKQYPDKPQTFNQSAGLGYTGVKQIKIAFIATEAGTIAMPEIQMNWWDVKGNRMRTSSLPELQLHVIADQIAPLSPPIQVEEVKKSHSIPVWAWMLIGLNAFWLIGIATMWFKNRKPKKVEVDKDPTLSQIKQNLKTACLANDAKGAEKALLAWAKITFPQIKPLNLAALIEHTTDDLLEEIEDLNESLYSPHTVWLGKDLWEAFSQFKPAAKPKAAEEVSAALKDLYS
jgi:BatD DUF11 like domain